MQIFKNILLACSVIVAVSPLGLRAEDNAAQSAARAALQQKMRELNGPSAVEAPSQPPAPVVVPPKPAEPVVAPPPAPVAPPPPSLTMSVPAGVSPDLIEQAREATRERLRELQGNPKTSIPAGHESVAPEPKSVVAPETAPATEPYVPAKTSKEEVRAKKEREAAEKRAAAEEAAAAKQAAKEAKEAKKAGTMEPAPAFSPLEAPASSLPASKEQRLQQLTEQYVADKISAEEYHEQRAKILAEP